MARDVTMQKSKLDEINSMLHNDWLYVHCICHTFNLFSLILERLVTIIDEDTLAMHARTSPNATHQGPLTRSRAKNLQEQVNSFISDYNFHTFKNVILPKCSILVVLRNIFEEEEEKLL